MLISIYSLNSVLDSADHGVGLHGGIAYGPESHRGPIPLWLYLPRERIVKDTQMKSGSDVRC